MQDPLHDLGHIYIYIYIYIYITLSKGSWKVRFRLVPKELEAQSLAVPEGLCPSLTTRCVFRDLYNRADRAFKGLGFFFVGGGGAGFT